MQIGTRLAPLVAIFIGTASVVAGCVETAAPCTRLGCQDGVTLQFVDQGVAVLSSRGVVVLNGERLPFECTTTATGASSPLGQVVQCLPGGSVHFVTTAVSSITLELEDTTTTKAISVTVPLAFEASYPNGEECEPVCESAHATVDLAASGS